MEPKIIKTDEAYEATLARIEELMDAAPNSPEEEELELLVLLIGKYEEEHYPIDMPDPVEAIQFRMEQEGLSRKDMIPYIGSQSKVSEVLNYKRPLSLSMIRALHEGLDIPAEVLLQEPYLAAETDPAWKIYPFNEMLKRGYFPKFKGTLEEAKLMASELLAELVSVFQGIEYKQISCKHGEKEIDRRALEAWQARATQMALQEALPPFSQDELNKEFLTEVIALTNYTKGPQMVRELLNNFGIHFIILRHLPKTYLDGAVFFAPSGHPVIGLTLRHDRLDNFWFTVFHELAHLKLHMSEKKLVFIDETDRPSDQSEQTEVEANTFACDQLIPPDAWRQISEQLGNSTDDELLASIAVQYRINPAILAGRVRWDRRDYRRFSALVGYGQVNPQFSD